MLLIGPIWGNNGNSNKIIKFWFWAIWLGPLISSSFRYGASFAHDCAQFGFGVSLIYVDTEIIRELDNQTVIAELGLGRLLAGSIFLALTTFVTVFVPVRTAGVFYGPRLGRYFDQIILSGITPWRFLMGKVLGQQAFFATVVAVSLPYFILCLSFGGVFFWEVLLCT